MWILVYFDWNYFLCYAILPIFSIGRPTYEFPHPLARVPQSAGYWVCSLFSVLFLFILLSYFLNYWTNFMTNLFPFVFATSSFHILLWICWYGGALGDILMISEKRSWSLLLLHTSAHTMDQYLICQRAICGALMLCQSQVVSHCVSHCQCECVLCLC